MVVVNRSDLGGDVGRVREVAERHGAEVIAEIPYSENIIRSYVEGRPIVLTHHPEAGLFRDIASKVVEFLRGW